MSHHPVCVLECPLGGLGCNVFRLQGSVCIAQKVAEEAIPVFHYASASPKP